MGPKKKFRVKKNPLKNSKRLHYRTAAELAELGNYIQPKPKFKVDSVEDLDKCVAIKTSNEVIIYKKKIYLQHFLFEKIPRRFVAWNPNSWRIHPFTFINPNKKYTVLAESDQSPQIVQIGHCVGTLFSVSEKYKFTAKILENFVGHIVNFLAETGYVAKQINVIGGVNS